jgi:hypothetical protein
VEQEQLPLPDAADLKLVNEVEQHLRCLQLPTGVSTAPELLSGAAYNLAGARVAHGLLRWKAQGDYDVIRRNVANEQWDVFEVASIDMCLRCVVTALDLCSAALFRLGGGQRRSGGETDLGRWDSDVAKLTLSLPTAVLVWVDLRNSKEYQDLRECRNDATHRRRQVLAAVGAPNALAIDFGGTSRPVLQLAEDVSKYGRTKFQELCALLLAL